LFDLLKPIDKEVLTAKKFVIILVEFLNNEGYSLDYKSYGVQSSQKQQGGPLSKKKKKFLIF